MTDTEDTFGDALPPAQPLLSRSASSSASHSATPSKWVPAVAGLPPDAHARDASCTVSGLVQALRPEGFPKTSPERAAETLLGLVQLCSTDAVATCVAREGFVDAATPLLMEYRKSAAVGALGSRLLLVLFSFPSTRGEVVAKFCGVPVLLDVMSRHLDKPEVVEQSVALVSKLSAAKVDVTVSVVTREAVFLLLRALQMHSADRIVLEHSLALLSVYCRDAILERQETLLTMLEVLLVQVDYSPVLKNFCKVTSLLCDAEGADPHHLSNCCHAILPLLARHSPNPLVCLHACYLLSKTSERTSEHIEEAVPVLVAAMGLHCRYAPLCSTVCRALSNLLKRDGAVFTKTMSSVSEGIAVLLRVLGSNSSSEDISGNALCVLCAVVPESPIGNTAELSEEGLVKALLVGCQEHMECLPVVECMCALLKKVTHIEAVARSVACQVVPFVTQALARHVRSEAVCECACATLWDLGVTDVGEQLVVQSGGIDAVVGALEAHRTSAAVCRNACGAVWNIGTSLDVVRRTEGCGLVVLVLRVLRDHVSVPDTCEQACGALWNLCLSAANAEIVLREGGPECLLAVVRQHLQRRSVVFRACLALGGLCHAEQSRAFVAERVALLITALRVHVASDSVSDTILSVIAALPLTESTDFLLHIDFVPLLVAALSRHAASEGVCAHCCELMVPLCANAKGQEQAVAAGGVEPLVSCLKTHPYSDTVVSRALAVLSLLCERVGVREAVVKCGAVQLLQGILCRFSENPRVARAACLCLFSLSVSDKALEELASAQCMQMLVVVLSMHVKHQHICEAVCGTFCNLCRDTGRRDKLVKLGAIAPVCAALQEHLHCASLAWQCCSALWNISLSPENRVAVAQKGFMLVVRVLTEHSKFLPICESACGVLVCCSMAGVSALPDLPWGTCVQPICAALGKHHENAALVRLASGVLYVLCSAAGDLKAVVAKEGAAIGLVENLTLFPKIAEAAALRSLLLNN
eukprot:m51a1_g5161 hypothetical protein (984) ;mRNA; f:111979-116481